MTTEDGGLRNKDWGLGTDEMGLRSKDYKLKTIKTFNIGL